MTFPFLPVDLAFLDDSLSLNKVDYALIFNLITF